MTIELWFLIQLDNGKEYDKDKDENDGKEFILLYGAPGVDLLAAVSSESKNLYSLPTNPTHLPLCYCWWHNLHWMFQWEFLCCIFAVYKFSWFSNVRFLLEVHCMRIAWRSITISIWHARRIYWSGYMTLSHRFVHSICIDWQLKPDAKKAGLHLQQCLFYAICISICKNCKGSRQVHPT